MVSWTAVALLISMLLDYFQAAERKANKTFKITVPNDSSTQKKKFIWTKLAPTVAKFVICHMPIKLRANCLYTAKKKKTTTINKLKENQTELSRHGTTPLYQNVFFHTKKAIHLNEISPTARKSMANQIRIKQRANWLLTANFSLLCDL